MVAVIAQAIHDRLVDTLVGEEIHVPVSRVG
jgi:hypothetical protein